jgi:hypothetical protein
MRRVTLMLAAVAMMVALFAVAAYAVDIQGNDSSDELWESGRNDTMAGHGGADDIFANFYTRAETVGGLGDTDKVKGNKGDDELFANDGDNRDIVNGGRGIDRCVADAGDEVKNCEL